MEMLGFMQSWNLLNKIPNKDGGVEGEELVMSQNALPNDSTNAQNVPAVVDAALSATADSASSAVDRTNFNPISKAALQRLEEIKKMINTHEWKENTAIVIPPSFHLVDAAFRIVRNVVIEKKLFIARRKLNEEELRNLVPKASNKYGVFFMVIATSKLLAHQVLALGTQLIMFSTTIIMFKPM